MPVDDGVVESGRVKQVFADPLDLESQCLVPGIADQQARAAVAARSGRTAWLPRRCRHPCTRREAGQLLLQLVALLGSDLLPGVGIEEDVHFTKVPPNLDVVAVHGRDLGLQPGRDTASMAHGWGRRSGLSGQLG